MQCLLFGGLKMERGCMNLCQTLATMSDERNGLLFFQNAIKSSAPKHTMGYFQEWAVQYNRKTHYAVCVSSVLCSSQLRDLQKLEGNCLTGATEESVALATPSALIG